MPIIISRQSDRAASALYMANAARPRPQDAAILVVDQDAAVRDALSLTLKASGFGVQTYRSGSALLDDATVKDGVCLLVEFDLEDMTALDLLEHLSIRRVDLPAVIMSARLRPLALGHPRPASISGVLLKPFGQDDLLRCIEKALARHPSSAGLRKTT